MLCDSRQIIFKELGVNFKNPELSGKRYKPQIRHRAQKLKNACATSPAIGAQRFLRWLGGLKIT